MNPPPRRLRLGEAYTAIIMLGYTYLSKVFGVFNLIKDRGGVVPSYFWFSKIQSYYIILDNIYR